MQLQVAVRHARLVREGQAARPADEAGHIERRERRRAAATGQPLAQREAEGAVAGEVGPVVLHADLDDVGEVRMVEPRGLLHLAQAQLERFGVVRLHAAREHHLRLRRGSKASQAMVPALLPSSWRSS